MEPTELHRGIGNPTWPEVELAKRNIGYAQGEIALLDNEIVSPQHCLQTLTDEQDVLQRFEFQEQSLSAPICKIPEDLLRRIFYEVRLYYDQKRGNTYYNPKELSRLDFGSAQDSTYDPTEFARTASQVCVYWRSVAQSCAFLWSDVRLSFLSAEVPESTLSGGVVLLTQCISYSAEAPFCADLGAGCTPDTLGQTCVRMLGNCAHRWSNIIISSGKLLKSILAAVTPPTLHAQLQSLKLGEVIDSVSISPTLLLTKLTIQLVGKATRYITLQDAPLLTYLNLEGWSVNISGTLKGIIWSQITHFEAHNIEFGRDELPAILHSMTNVLHFGLTTWGIGTELPIILPSLERLMLCGPTTTEILNILTTPNLKMLGVTHHFTVAHVSDFARRSGCAIEELKLFEMDFDGQEWSMPEFQTIQKLHWKHPYDIENALAWLPTVFPRLTNLTIENIGYFIDSFVGELMISGLINLLESRLPKRNDETTSSITLHTLQTVKITFDSDLDRSDINTLKDFGRSDTAVKSGVNIAIMDYEGNNLC